MRAIKYIAKLLKCSIAHAPSVILTPYPNPTASLTPAPTTTILLIFPEPLPVPSTIPLIVTTISSTLTSTQVQRLPLKPPRGADIPASKSSFRCPIRPCLYPWARDPLLRNTHTEALSQLVIQEHPNHTYHPVTGLRDNYENSSFKIPSTGPTACPVKLDD